MLKLLAFTTVLLIGARSAEVSLIFDSSEIIVNPGEPLHLDCGVRGDMRYCIWGNENDEVIQVEDVHNNLYDGLSKPENTNGNECGIVVDSVNTQQHGKWTCRVFIPANSLVGSKNVVVTIKPTSPMLEIDNLDKFVVNTVDDKTVVCSVAAARPAVDMKWYLGDKDITAMSEKVETLTDAGDIYKSVSTLTRRFMPDDNGKLLMCSINHKTLLSPDNASVPVSVVFKPIEKEVTTFYQIKLGSDYEVKFNVSANPKPYAMMWTYGENPENPEGTINIPGVEGRYSADIEDFGNDMYTAKLLIREFSEVDAERKYFLLMENEVGQTQYTVRLSVHDAPLDGVSETSNHDKIPPSELSVSDSDLTESNALSGGAIAGIIIVLLVVVVAIVAAGYARYRQMFCFASRAESKAHIQDPERNETDNGTANDAIKSSTDHVNGKTDNTVANGNGNLEQTQVEEVNNEKKNTDV